MALLDLTRFVLAAAIVLSAINCAHAARPFATDTAEARTNQRTLTSDYGVPSDATADPAPLPRLQTTSSNDLQASMDNLVQAFCKHQSGAACDEVDWHGTSWWYRYLFSDFPSIEISSGLTAPKIVSEKRSQSVGAEHICLYSDISSDCYLQETIFKSEASSHTESDGWNTGTSTKVTSMWGASVAGNELLAGVTASFQFKYSFQDAEGSGTTEYYATTGRLSISMSPEQKACLVAQAEFSAVEAMGTQTAWLAAKHYVGVAQNYRMDSSSMPYWDGGKVWSADANGQYLGGGRYTGASPLPLPFRRLAFSDIVARSKAAGLPEAKDWVLVDGEARIEIPITVNLELATSGWYSYLYYPLDHPRCQLMGAAEAPSSLRVLKSGSSTAATVREAVALGTASNPLIVYGAGGTAAAAASKQQQVQDGAAQPTVGPALAASLAVEAATNNRPGVGLRSAVSPPPDFTTAVYDFVLDWCYARWGMLCWDVDVTGASEWYQQDRERWQFYHPDTPLGPPPVARPGISELQMEPLPSNIYDASNPITSSFMCAYNPVANQNCRVTTTGQYSNTATESHKTSYSYDAKVGAKLKFEYGLFAAQESELEVSFDFGYSNSETDANSTVSGSTTVAGRTAVMTPADKVCSQVSVSLQRVKQSGSISAYVEYSGWVALVTKGVPGSAAYYNLADLVREAKDGMPRNLGERNAAPTDGRFERPSTIKLARGGLWELVADAGVMKPRLATRLGYDFDLGYTSSSKVDVFPYDDPRCPPTGNWFPSSTA